MRLSQARLDKPINVVCHDGTQVLINDVAGVHEVTPETTMAIAQSMSEDDWNKFKSDTRLVSLLRTVFPNLVLPNHALQMHGSGVRHVVGMIVALDFHHAHGNTVMLRTPESYLHPSAQLGLADLLIKLSQL